MRQQPPQPHSQNGTLNRQQSNSHVGHTPTPALFPRIRGGYRSHDKTAGVGLAADEPPLANGTNRTSSIWSLPRLLHPVTPSRSPATAPVRLTSRHLTLLEEIARYRYVTCSQLHQLLARQFGSLRTVQRHLATLVQTGHAAIATNPPTSHFPFVYLITAQGIRHLQSEYAQRGRAYVAPAAAPSAGITNPTLVHEVSVAQVDLAIRLTASSLRHSLVAYRRFSRHRSAQMRFAASSGSTVTFAPDSASVIHHDGQKSFWCVEVDHASNSSPRKMRRKLAVYRDWLASPEGYRTLAGRTFRLLIVVAGHASPEEDETRLASLLALTLPFSRDFRERIWFTTASWLLPHEHDPAPLAAPVWLRVRHARTWLPALRSYEATLPKAQQFSRFLDGWRARFIRTQLNTMPRQPLFAAQNRSYRV